MRDKLVFRKNLLMLFIVCCIMAIVEESVFAYFSFCTDVFVEESRQVVFIVITCSLLLAMLCMTWMLFRQYLIVNDETVTFCKLFKRKQTILWKDATVTQAVIQQNGVAQQGVVISDGLQEISFVRISDKDLSLLKDLCKTAREKYNIDVTI